MAFDLASFDLPYGFERFSTNPRPVSSALVKDYRTNLETEARRWEDWVVKLEITKQKVKKYGNGFYVNLPTKNFDLILTAGHNLTEAPKMLCRNIKIIGAGDKPDTVVTPDMIRVSRQYLEKPSELNQIYDYGAIILPRDPARPLPMGFGFGFNLMLGLTPVAGGRHEDAAEDILLGREVSVSGYKTGDNPKALKTIRDVNYPGGQRVERAYLPRRASGDCVRVDEDQLRYKAEIVEGISGGPVWLGFRGVETVVGIHNYAEAAPGQGHRACRLNLNIWADVFEWTGLGWSGIYLSYNASLTYSMHLHIGAPPDGEPEFARVRVGKPGVVETRFTVLPVSSRPNDRYKEACYSFLHDPAATPSFADGSNAGRLLGLSATDIAVIKAEESQKWWLQWDAQAETVSFSRQFDGRCEVKMLNIADSPDQPLGIHVRLDAKSWMQVAMGMELLQSWDLACLDKAHMRVEDTSEVSFRKASTKANLFQMKR